jgi:hypothetical protein
LVLWVILTEGLQLSSNEVGKSGILKNDASWVAFLTAAERRIRFIHVLKRRSWLNQVEILCNVVSRGIHSGDFTIAAALTNRLLKFIDYFNATMAKPDSWTFDEQTPTARSRYHHRPAGTYTPNPLHTSPCATLQSSKQIRIPSMENRGIVI